MPHTFRSYTLHTHTTVNLSSEATYDWTRRQWFVRWFRGDEISFGSTLPLVPRNPRLSICLGREAKDRLADAIAAHDRNMKAGLVNFLDNGVYGHAKRHFSWQAQCADRNCRRSGQEGISARPHIFSIDALTTANIIGMSNHSDRPGTRDRLKWQRDRAWRRFASSVGMARHP
jgi:hypothetical protein